MVVSPGLSTPGSDCRSRCNSAGGSGNIAGDLEKLGSVLALLVSVQFALGVA